MASIIVTLSRSDSEWLPHVGDYDTFVLRYSLVDSEHSGRPNEESFTRQQSVKVKVSRSTQKAWGLIKPDPDLDKVVFQFALDLIARKAETDSLTSDEQVDLSNDAPAKCPYDPGKVKLTFDVPLEYQITRPFGFKRP